MNCRKTDTVPASLQVRKTSVIVYIKLQFIAVDKRSGTVRIAERRSTPLENSNIKIRRT